MSDNSSDVHTPRYVVRRQTVRDTVRRLPPGRFLEIGCGRGEMLPMLQEYGYSGVAVEISEAVFPRAVATASTLGPSIDVVASLDGLPEAGFEYLFAFEVLEHIEDDTGSLQEWLRYLRPGGRVVITVPSRMKLWSASDEAVGHVRRYERHELIELFEGNGLRVVQMISLGYPLVLFTRPLRHLQHRLRGESRKSAHQRTLESSMDSTLAVPQRAMPLVRNVVQTLGLAFYYAGLPLRRTNYGDGYLVVAELPAL